MAGNGEKKYRKILEGIQYLIGDNKHLREELAEFARQAAEDRKRADDDRRRADERFEKLLEKSDERFDRVLDQVRRTNRVALEIARDIRKGQHQILEGQKQVIDKLDAILKKLPPAGNGK